MGKISQALEKSRKSDVKRVEPVTPRQQNDAAPPEPSKTVSEIPTDKLVRPEIRASAPPPGSPEKKSAPLRAGDSTHPAAEDAAAHSSPPPFQVHEKLIVCNAPRSHEAEQFRMLRTNILFPKSGVLPKSILITSALPEEGKTFISANLAVTLAQHIDTHVLLIDADLRKPDLHTYFGVSARVGLCEVLQGRAAISDALMPTFIDRLTLLPAGRTPDNPSELLSSRKMKTFLRDVANRYSDRLVLIDSPPPKLISETCAMASHVDGILLVVKFLKSNKEMTSELTELIGRDRILGVVGNYLNLKALSYYGKSKYAAYGNYPGNGGKR